MVVNGLPHQAKRKKQMTEKPAKKQKSGESSKTSGASKSGGGGSNKKDNMFQVRSYNTTTTNIFQHLITVIVIVLQCYIGFNVILFENGNR